MTGDKPEKKELPVKSDIALREEATLASWKENRIFEKSLEQTKGKPEFVFYDGPPFATGLPHTGTLLASVAKDILPRYKTMRGFYVRRRWGWDTHGLPIENMIEKDLGLKSKKDILEMGIEKFNEACRAKVMQYAHDWQKYVDRIGRWVEFEDAYKTMDASYTESVWWALKQLSDKGLLYEGRKVLMYCPHCETPLAKAEIAMDNSYKDVTEEAVTVKFKAKEFTLLAWTTTPWTLPANVALAVGPEIEYSLVEKDGEKFVLASALVEKHFGANAEVDKTFFGKELENLEYEPLYEIDAVKKTGKRSHYVTLADFVSTEEGTGIVHTAVLYGEDDYQLGLKNDLPMVPLLNSNGTYNNDAPEFLRGQYIKKADKLVIEDLEKRGLMFAHAPNTHSYPHCYRCGTALIYNALSSWFINIQKIKARMIELNEKINWVPEHLKHGRFLHIVENAPDWTISRNRFWASPLPIWKCADCKKVEVIGSLEELSGKAAKSGNSYFIMRHGEAVANLTGIIDAVPGGEPDTLTEKGQLQVAESAAKLGKVDYIFHSPFGRSRESALIAAEKLGVSSANVIQDDRIGEYQAPGWEGRTWKELWAEVSDAKDNMPHTLGRMFTFLQDIDDKYQGKKILVVSHGLPICLLTGSDREFDNAEIQEFKYVPTPRNSRGELDFHRPYIDRIKLTCECGSEMTRIPEVIDCWVESGSMPFAEYHYPFEHKSEFEKRSPSDYVAEYIAQTRTWFYYMLAISTALFDKEPFKNVVTTGNLQAADGAKISKSKKNYSDPLDIIDRYGADALRFVLMASPVMMAEDVAFRDEDVKEVSQRLVNILWNVVTFYNTYSGQAPKGNPSGENVLDKWVLARLAQLHHEVTTNLDAYNTPAAMRPVREFVSDLSNWYLRRSRDRFKSDDVADREAAISTMRYVLLELSKILAPVMPFLADQIYIAIGGKLESVHLETWTPQRPGSAGQGDSDKLVENMKVTREVVTLALEARQKADIKVRQPLANLTVKVSLSEEYLALVKAEVNVKEVLVDEKLAEGEVMLDVTLTPELEAEGKMRDLVRLVQDKRKEANLQPSDKITVKMQKSLTYVIKPLEQEFKKTVNATEIVETDNEEVEIEKA